MPLNAHELMTTILPAIELTQRRALCVALLLIVFAGCPNKPNEDGGVKGSKAKPAPLVVLVADDPPLAAAIAREWRGRTEEDLTVRDLTLDQLSRASRIPGDVVIFPPGHLGEFAERSFIVPLENQLLEEADFHYRDIFDLMRLRELRWSGRTYAAPLGSPQLLLCYRADLFDRIALPPPTDWRSYHQAVERFAQHADHADQLPTIEPLADGWAGQTLLARAAGYAVHRDQLSPLFRLGTLEPLIDQPPFVRALEELVAAVKAAKADKMRTSPAEAFQAIASGQCVMALAWPTSGVSGELPPSRAGKLAFAALPASRQAYHFATSTWNDRDAEDTGVVPLLSIAGRVAAISASSQDAARAGGLVIWLAGRDTSEHVGPTSAATTLFRQSQVAHSGRWTPQLTADESRQYAETLAGTLSRPKAMNGLTLPGRRDYLAALDRAVADALGGKPAAEALAAAANQWREITSERGEEAQRRAHSHSLGQSTQ